MLTPEQVRQKAAQKYLLFLQAFLRDKTFFPLEIPFAKTKASDDYMTIRESVQALQAHAKTAKGYGYSLELQTRNTRRYGTQSLPSRIYFESERDFLKLIGKESEWDSFKGATEHVKTTLPQLFDWLQEHPGEVLENLGKWSDLLEVCHYFLAHPAPELYIRELPVAVHSKFIEENKGILRQLLNVLLSPPHIDEAETDFERRFRLKRKEAARSFQGFR